MKLGCHSYQFGERIGFHLLHYLTTMCLYRNLADAEFPTNLFVQESGDDQRHNLPFAGSQRGVPVPEFLHLRVMRESEATSFKSLPDGGQQDLVIEGFCQEFDSPRLHGLD